MASTPPLSLRLLVEFLGTFILVMAVTLLCTSNGLGPFGAAGIVTVVLGSLVAAGGPLSGGHYNPAVSLGIWAKRLASGRDTSAYITCQLAAGLLAGVIGKALPLETPELLDPNVGSAVAAEAGWTFLLVSVILMVTALGANRFATGIAVGGTVGAGALVVGSVSGAAFNPAVWLGLTIIDKMALSDWTIYVVAPLSGGVLAAVVASVIAGRSTAPTD